ncbi:MAG TPA: hypothetical protein VKJ07_22770, partial [Mycobacteriales bacterium]|nr:hypothetical protein [Mycobacteriales bacterium]
MNRVVAAAGAALVLVFIALGGSSAAQASVVEVRYGPPSCNPVDGCFPGSYRFGYGEDGHVGDANDVSITALANAFHVRDVGATLSVGARCISLGPHDARCQRPHSAPLAYYIDAGYGDDTVSLAGAFNGSGPSADQLRVDGGVGNDVLNGSASPKATASLNGNFGDDVLNGGPSPEDLTGGPGSDRINGGGGNDYIVDGEDPAYGPVSSDVIDGGPGRDTISYTGGDPQVPLTIDLTRGV